MTLISVSFAMNETVVLASQSTCQSSEQGGLCCWRLVAEHDREIVSCDHPRPSPNQLLITRALGARHVQNEERLFRGRPETLKPLVFASLSEPVRSAWNA